MNNNQEQSFQLYLKQAEAAGFSGWDFSYLGKTERMVTTPLEWNYHDLIYPYLLTAGTMLDMGTGGGEFLSLLDPRPVKTIATELYKPNVPVARKRLEPLGIEVVTFEEKGPTAYEEMPFGDGYFDLVIDRHESYYPPELARILKPGGMFITQQVGNKNLSDFLERLTGDWRVNPEWDVNITADELELAGLTVLMKNETFGIYRFYDIGAIVYLMKAVPWMVEDFTVDRYRDKLWKLHEEIQTKGYYDAVCHRFVIVCRR